MRPSKARSLRDRAIKETTGGPRQSPRSVCLPSARSSKFMFSRTSGASGRGAVRGKARGPAVRAKRCLPGPGKGKVPFAGGSGRSPRSGRSARPGGREGAPWGRTGAGVNRPWGGAKRGPKGDCNREGGRGNTGVAAVHKAGGERRFGATPATATPPPSSSARHGSTTMAKIHVSQARVCGHCRDGTVVVAACPVSGRFGQLTVTGGCRKSGCGAGVFLPAARVLCSKSLAG